MKKIATYLELKRDGTYTIDAMETYNNNIVFITTGILEMRKAKIKLSLRAKISIRLARYLAKLQVKWQSKEAARQHKFLMSLKPFTDEQAKNLGYDSVEHARSVFLKAGVLKKMEDSYSPIIPLRIKYIPRIKEMHSTGGSWRHVFLRRNFKDRL